MSFGALFGAASSLQSGFGGNSSLKDFLSQMDSMGVQITSRFEATFSAIPQTTFYIKNINTPGMKQNITSLYFDGKMVEIPQNFEYEHDFNMTVINDASGIIYTALTNFIMSDSGATLANSGYTISIKAIGDNKHKGATIKLNGVRIKSIGGLNFEQSGGDIQTFDVQCSAIDFEYAPGSLSKVTGITGAIGSITGGSIGSLFN